MSAAATSIRVTGSAATRSQRGVRQERQAAAARSSIPPAPKPDGLNLSDRVNLARMAQLISQVAEQYGT